MIYGILCDHEKSQESKKMNGVFFKMLVYISSKLKKGVDIEVDTNKITYVDPAHITMCKITSEKAIPVAGCEDKHVSFTAALAKKMKVDKKADITFSVNEKGELLAATNTGVVNFPMGQVDKLYCEPKYPELILNGKFKIPFKEFNQIVEDIGSVSDNIRFFFNGDNLTVKCYGPGQDNIVFEKTMKVENLNGWNDEIVCCFPLDYIRIILGSNLDKTDMVFEADTDYPIKIRWDLLDGANESHAVEWLLAPRVESDY